MIAKRLLSLVVILMLIAGAMTGALAQGEHTLAAQAADPGFDITCDEETKLWQVSITCATKGAAIWYNMYEDGALVTEAAQYEAPLALTPNKVVDIEAWASAEGLADSATTYAQVDTHISVTGVEIASPAIKDGEVVLHGAAEQFLLKKEEVIVTPENAGNKGLHLELEDEEIVYAAYEEDGWVFSARNIGQTQTKLLLIFRAE